MMFHFCLTLTKGSVPECGRPLEEYYLEWPRIDRPASEHNFASPLLPEHRNLKTGSLKCFTATCTLGYVVYSITIQSRNKNMAQNEGTF
jgi:hypothetical protein